MTESKRATYEEAKCCPKCGKPGEHTSSRPAPAGATKGAKIHAIYCRTPLCPWEDTCWYVQVNPDGSIPEAKNHTGEAKLYEGFKDHDEQAIALIQSLKRQAERETKPGYEINNPYSR